MKITVRQLRRIIKEEVEAGMAANGGWSAEKTAASDPKLVAAALPGILGKPAARPEICGELAAAIVLIAKRVLAGEKIHNEGEVEVEGPLEQLLGDAMETTVDPEAPGSRHVVYSQGDFDRIVDTFFGVPKTKKKSSGGSLRNKHPNAFEACDDNTLSGRAEKDWWFYEDESPEDDGTIVLWADPRVSGDPIWWDDRRELWLEEDGTEVW